MKPISTSRQLGILLVAVSASTTLYGEIPLPDFVVYGQLRDAGGQPVVSGALTGSVRRGGTEVLRVDGVFVEEGMTFYLLQVPMETAIGAPGPSGTGGHDGDVLQILLDGELAVPDAPIPALRGGGLVEVDASTSSGGGTVFLRGDCNDDLVVDLADAVNVLFFLFVGSVQPSCERACDSNDDRAVDSSDAVMLLEYLFLEGPLPPTPSAVCGPDPDSDPVPSCDASACN